MLRPPAGPSSSVPRGVGADLAPATEAIARRGITVGTPLHLLADTTSTNDLAKDAARSGHAHGVTFVAELQTAGRGRQGRAWMAARGEALLVSVLFRLACPPLRLPSLALAAGLAARDAVARWTREEPMLKWPNDVLLGGRKVAGVLVEGVLQGDKVTAVVVGVGINVHTRAFPDEIAGIATSIALHAKEGVAPDRAELLADLLAGLDRDLALVAARGVGLVHSRLVRWDALRGRRVAGDEVEGIADGIDLEGRLQVRRADGTLARVNAGEVRLVSSPE